MVGRFVLWLWSFPALARLALISGAAVHDKHALSSAFVSGFVEANLRNSHRRMKTRRFLAGQLDLRNNRSTLEILDRLRRFELPTISSGEKRTRISVPSGRGASTRKFPAPSGWNCYPRPGTSLWRSSPNILWACCETSLKRRHPCQGHSAERKDTLQTWRCRRHCQARPFTVGLGTPTPGPTIYRRQALLAMGAAFVAGAAVGRAHEQQDTHSHISRARFPIPLGIPPVLRPTRSDTGADYYEIRQQESRIEVFPGAVTTVWGYEGLFPGPTIKARRGRPVVVRHTNELSHHTVVHLHGAVTTCNGFPTEIKRSCHGTHGLRYRTINELRRFHTQSRDASHGSESVHGAHRPVPTGR